MKHIALLLPFLALVASAPIAAQESEQNAVRKVIEGETEAFRLCDFDGWANHWLHEPYDLASFTWPNSHTGLVGWSDIAAWGKGYIADCVPDETPVEKYDYKYKISGDMAFVTFLEGEGNESTRVLEKRNGQWKIIRVGVIGTTAFRGLAQRQEMERMSGRWQADLTSVKYGVPVPFELTELSLECQPNASGVTIASDWRYSQGGDSWGYTRKAELAYDAVAGGMGAFVVGTGSSGSSRIFHGKATYQDGVLSIESTPMGDSSGAYDRWEYRWKAGNVLHMKAASYDAEGNPQFVTEVDFIRSGWRGT